MRCAGLDRTFGPSWTDPGRLDTKYFVLAERKRVFVVDDHPVFRLGLTQLVQSDEALELAGEADSVSDALERVGGGLDLVVADLSLGGQSGLDLVRELKKRGLDMPVLVVSMHDETLYAERALRAGASGYLMKSAPPTELLDGIHRALRRELVVSERVSSMVLSRLYRGDEPTQGASMVASLSDRELQIFEMIGTGARTREIAERLSISAKTVDTHKSHIKRKLGIERSTDLLRAAMAWVSEQDEPR